MERNDKEIGRKRLQKKRKAERGMQREEKTDRERKARIWKGNEGERRRNGKMQDEEGKKMERQR